jgi:hypothetical protein
VTNPPGDTREFHSPYWREVYAHELAVGGVEPVGHCESVGG